MINLINEKKIPQWQVRLVHQAINNSTKFLKQKYDIDFFKYGCDIKISNSCRFAYYNFVKKIIRIDGKRNFWLTYKRKRVGVYADEINVGYELSYTLMLIHELTHHIQHLEKRKASEVETTKNEIEYVTQFHPYLLKKLKPV